MLLNDDITSLHFIKVKFDNKQSKNAVLYSQSGGYGVMIDGIALRKIKSNDKERSFNITPVECDKVYSKLQGKAEDLILYETNISSRTLDSERKVLELVKLNYEWSENEIERLSELFRTRNVINKKKATQLKANINSAVRNGASPDSLVKDLRKILPQLKEEAPQIDGNIEILTNFYNKILWRS